MTGTPSERRLELVAVRHGRTAWNRDKRYQGHTDVPLDDVGRAQARLVGVGLAPLCFDGAVSSDLSRARETADIVLGMRHLAVALDARWRELAFGAWEGLTWSEIVVAFPELAKPDAGTPFPTPEGGESFSALCSRVGEAVAAVDSAYPDGARVLIATHAGPLHALLHVTLGERAEALAVTFAPGSVTRIVREAGHPWQIAELNRVPRPTETDL